MSSLPSPSRGSIILDGPPDEIERSILHWLDGSGLTGRPGLSFWPAFEGPRSFAIIGEYQGEQVQVTFWTLFRTRGSRLEFECAAPVPAFVAQCFAALRRDYTELIVESAYEASKQPEALTIAERDAEIYRLHIKDEKTARALAHQFKLGESRIWQILRQQKAKLTL
jgi:hypothetical protein